MVTTQLLLNIVLSFFLTVDLAEILPRRTILGEGAIPGAHRKPDLDRTDTRSTPLLLILVILYCMSQRKTSAVVLLQRVQRRLSMRAKYCAIYTGIVALQRRAKQSFQAKTRSAILLQRQWRMFRGFAALQKVAKRIFAVKTRWCIAIQANHRKNSARESFREARKAAIKITSQWRSASTRSEYNKMLGGFKSLQLLARNSYHLKARASITLQQHTRMLLGKMAYQANRFSTIQIQNTWRRHFCRTRYIRQKRGFGILQLKGKLSFQEKTRSVLRLQSNWRMESSKRSFATTRAAAVVIEAGCRVRTEIQFELNSYMMDSPVYSLVFFVFFDNS